MAAAADGCGWDAAHGIFGSRVSVLFGKKVGWCVQSLVGVLQSTLCART